MNFVLLTTVLLLRRALFIPSEKDRCSETPQTSLNSQSHVISADEAALRHTVTKHFKILMINRQMAIMQ